MTLNNNPFVLFMVIWVLILGVACEIKYLDAPKKPPVVLYEDGSNDQGCVLPALGCTPKAKKA